ncbi:MAG: AAA family ATPase [Nanobdellota archaeon]
MKITITGTPGSGKSTVSELIKNRLGQNHRIVDVGALRRQFAKDKGMTIEEFNEWSENNPSEGDEYFDNKIESFGKDNNDFIVVARLGFYFIPQSIKVFLYCNEKIAAERIFNQKSKENKRNELEVSSIEKQMKIIKERMESDSKRYKMLYDVDPYDKDNFDISIDTSEISQEESAELILKKIHEFKN